MSRAAGQVLAEKAARGRKCKGPGAAVGLECCGPAGRLARSQERATRDAGREAPGGRIVQARGSDGGVCRVLSRGASGRWTEQSSRGSPEFSFPGKHGRKASQGPDGQLGPGRQEVCRTRRCQRWPGCLGNRGFQTPPQGFPGSSKPDSLLVIQQHGGVKKSISWHTQSFGLPLPEPRSARCSPELSVQQTDC